MALIGSGVLSLASFEPQASFNHQRPKSQIGFHALHAVGCQASKLPALTMRKEPA